MEFMFTERFIYYSVILKIFQVLNQRNSMLAYIVMRVKHISMVRYVTEEIHKKGYLRQVSYSVYIELIKGFTIYEFNDI